jgi:hypothetical protein
MGLGNIQKLAPHTFVQSAKCGHSVVQAAFDSLDKSECHHGSSAPDIASSSTMSFRLGFCWSILALLLHDNRQYVFRSQHVAAVALDSSIMH